MGKILLYKNFWEADDLEDSEFNVITPIYDP